MCMPAIIASAASALGTVGAATAAGTTAAAATSAAGTLATIGTAVSVGGSLLSGIQNYQAGKAQQEAIVAQQRTEAELSAVKDNRTRMQFQAQVRQQMAELAARGVQMDSPTAVLLGRTAAQEMAFESQAIRSAGGARNQELSAAAQIAGGRARAGLLDGTFKAAGSLLTAAPKLWPELLS